MGRTGDIMFGSLIGGIPFQRSLESKRNLKSHSWSQTWHYKTPNLDVNSTLTCKILPTKLSEWHDLCIPPAVSVANKTPPNFYFFSFSKCMRITPPSSLLKSQWSCKNQAVGLSHSLQKISLSSPNLTPQWDTD